MNETTFIYVLKDPDTGHVRYIGKSDNPVLRWVNHARDAERRKNWDYPIARWIRKLHEEGKIPSLEVLDEIPKSEWQFWEKEYIRLFRALAIRPGLNVAEGGDGGILQKEISDDTRRKMQEAHRGKIHSTRTRAKMSAAHKGKRFSLSHRLNLGLVNKGRKRSAETCSKISASHVGLVPWNKGKKGLQTAWNKGLKMKERIA